MWKRSGTLMLGLLLALGAVATTALPAAAAGSARVKDAKTATFTLADGTVATATISGGGDRAFADDGKSLSAWSGTDAMYAEGVSAKDLPVVGIHSKNDCGSSKRCGEGQITVRFDRPVDDPAIHIAEFGAGGGASNPFGGGLSAADGIRFASADGGATAAVVSRGATFTDGGDGYHRGDSAIKCTAATKPGGCGSLTVPGKKITEIVFDVARFGLSASQSGFVDGYAFGVTATATPVPTPEPTPTPTPTPEPTYAALSVSKIVDKGAAVPGDQLEYTVTVKNTGDAEARQVPVTDVLPSGLTTVSADQGGTIEGSTIAWTIDSIPAGGQSRLHVTGTVDPSSAGATLVNRAGVENPVDSPAGTPAPTSTTPCADDPSAACATTVVAALPALSLSKVVDKQVAGHGEALAYTVVVANSGLAPAVDVPVVDHLPTTLTDVSADQGGVIEDGTVRWTVAEVPAGGQVELHVVGTTPAGLDEAQLVNRATVQNSPGVPAGTPDPTILTPCIDDVAQACAVTAIPALASLEISKTVAQAAAQSGAILDYTITVVNTGPGTATQIPVVDDLPDGTRFISASTGGVAVKDRVGWMVEEILPGQSATMSLRAQVPATLNGKIVNRATVAYDEVMNESLRSAAKQAGMPVPENADLTELPALPPLTAAHACADDASWSCAVTTVTPAPAALAQTGATFALAIPAVILLAGGAFLIVVGVRRRSNR
ncbi:hypothetical protein [Microbacterium oxydans]|uniref:hypothetical protein n=1 Tax=Microbacterium oxydans TaxID=82380 RepID=UPI0024ACEF7F|nr:hypothetical protein [Microbacterium oxydans]